MLANDTDADSNNLTITNLSSITPDHGAVVIENNKVKYTPESGYVGEVTFTYTPNDGNVDGNVTTVTINIAASCATNTYDDASYDSCNTYK